MALAAERDYELSRNTPDTANGDNTSVGADLSRPPPIYRPSDTLHTLINLLNLIITPVRTMPSYFTFNQINWTHQRVRAKRWTVRRGPIYRARGEVWPMPSIASTLSLTQTNGNTQFANNIPLRKNLQTSHNLLKPCLTKLHRTIHQQIGLPGR